MAAALAVTTLVLLPLRHQIPAHLAGKVFWGPRRPHLQAAAGAFGVAYATYHHRVNGVAVGKMIAHAEGSFAPRPCLPLRALGTGHV